MKMSIEWHEASLKNMERSWKHERQRAEMAMEAVKRGEGQVAFYQSQIDEAKRRKLTAFDDERLLVKRVSKRG